MDGHGIRRAYLDLLRERGHVRVARAPLVPRDDPTTLFTGSGMQPLLPNLLGEPHPAGTRLVDVQPCLRAQDVDEVGDNRHTTFFEMLGNWTLGECSKPEQVELVWHFLTGVVGLDPNRLHVTAFLGDPEHGIPRDEESAEVWARLFAGAGVSADRVDLGTTEHGDEVGSGGARIAFYGRKNWWSRFGGPDEMPVGEPGGPDTEVFYSFPDVEHDTRFGRFPHPNSDGGRFLEIGNSVFTAFRRTATGFAELPRPSVDFGGGLERIAAAALDSPDVYRVDLLRPIVERLQRLSGRSYEDHLTAMRVVVDHVRGAVFLVADGVRPGNRLQGYVLRRLVRRAVRFALDLGLTGGLADLVPVVTRIYEEPYPEVARQREEVADVLAREERAFARTLRRGLARLDALGPVLTGAHLFELHDTHGMPVELGVEEARRRGLGLAPGWGEEYDRLRGEQRDRSRAGRRAP